MAWLRAAPDHASSHPDLRSEQQRIQEVVKAEEERFAETLDTGVAKIREYLEVNRNATEKVADGKFLFTLYDTYGFPLDLAQEVLQESGWSVPQASLDAYEAEMASQRERARAGAAFGGGEEAESTRLFGELSTEVPAVEFVGYQTLNAPARILVMVKIGRRLREAVAGDEVEVILDR